MPNNRGGKKFKRGKKFSNFNSRQTRELVYKQSDQEYARLDRNLGERRFEIMCSDGIQRIAHVPGSFAKRLWFNVGDYVLVSMRSFEPNKCDILYKYNSNEIEQLRSENKLGSLGNDGTNEDHEFDEFLGKETESGQDNFFTKESDDSGDDFFIKEVDDGNEDFFTKTSEKVEDEFLQNL